MFGWRGGAAVVCDDGAMSDVSSIEQRLTSDLTASMKAGDRQRTSTLRMVVAAIRTASVAGDAAVVLDESAVVQVLRSELKRRVEAAEVYEQAGRDEQAAAERAEAAVIEEYLPAAMSDDALREVVLAAVATVTADGTEGKAAMGQVIGRVRGEVGDAADGGRIATMVRSVLDM